DGNMTGVSFLGTATGAIRMMREAVPNAAVMGLFVNPANPNAEPDTQEAQNAARKLGLELHVVGASNAQEIDTAFATLIQQRAHALVIDGDTLFSSGSQAAGAGCRSKTAQTQARLPGHEGSRPAARSPRWRGGAAP